MRDHLRIEVGASHPVVYFESFIPMRYGGNNQSLPALTVDHLSLPCDYGSQDFLLFALRHVEVVQCSGDLCSNLVELFGCNVEVFMGFVHVLAGVLKRSTCRLAEPECPHEFQVWQLAQLVPFLQGWVHIEFRILDDFVTEAVNDDADGVDTPDPFVKTFLCHRYSLWLLSRSSESIVCLAHDRAAKWLRLGHPHRPVCQDIFQSVLQVTIRCLDRLTGKEDRW